MAKKVGKDCKVSLGANQVLGLGTWSLSGITADQHETTEFGDEWKQFDFGLRDGGQISFNGLFDPADNTGQEALREANVENSDLTTLRLYVDNTSYYEPCQTTGYLSPTTTQNAATELSHVNITSFDVSADKGGMMNCSFNAKVSGVMVLI